MNKKPAFLMPFFLALVIAGISGPTLADAVITVKSLADELPEPPMYTLRSALAAPTLVDERFTHWSH